MPVTLDVGASAGIDKTYIDIFRTHSGAEDPAEYFKYDIRSVTAPLTATADDFTSYYDTIPPGTTFDEFGVGHVPAGDFPLGLDIHPWYNFSNPKQIMDYPFPVFEMDERVVREVRDLQDRGFVVSAAAGSINEWCYYLRGMDRFLMDMVLHKEMARETLKRVTHLCISIGKALAEAGVDILCYYGDMGSQNSLLMGPEMWSQWIKPRWQEIIREVRKISKTPFNFYHSCGYIEPIIRGLIEAGFDIINPIQPESMDPVRIKNIYGDKIALWGGIGMQSTMLNGSAEEVQQAVRDLIEVWAHRGGAIVTAAQTMLPDVAWENVQTLVDTVKDYSREVFRRLNPEGQ
jgi:uroporphyrinogen decarboxylase